MELGLLALIGLMAASTFISSAQNQLNVKNEREYNEDMYNKYTSPAATAEQMRKAGIGEAAIAQSIAGAPINGGTVIQDNPSHNGNNLSDIITNAINAQNTQADTSNKRLTGSEIRANIENIGWDTINKQNEALIKEEGWEQAKVTTDIMKRTKENAVKLSNRQLEKFGYETQQAFEEMQIAHQKGDVAKYEAAAANWKRVYLNTYQYPIELANNDPKLFKIVQRILGMISGTVDRISDGWIENQEAYNTPSNYVDPLKQ